MPLPELGSAVGLKTSALNLKDFITHVFPKNFFEAMAANEILQILVFAVFFGLALGHLHNQAARSLVNTMEEVVHVMLKVTDYVMRFAPIGVFGAVAGIITTQGLGMLVVFGKLLASFYIALAVLWLVLIAAVPLVERVPSAGLALLVAGGLAYTGGVVFFMLDSRLRYAHAVWHAFVAAGTGLHFFAVLGYAA